VSDRISTKPIATVALGAVLGLLLAAVAAAGIAERVADLNPGMWTEKVRGICGGSVRRATAFPGLVFADRGAACEIFAVEIDTGELTPVAHLGAPRSTVDQYLGRTGEVRFFLASGLGGWGYWRTDGTQAGTLFLARQDPSAMGWETDPLFVAGDPWSYLAVHRDDTGRELWRTDGTLAGTGPVIDLWPGPGSGFRGSNAEVHDDLLFFLGATPEAGLQVWRTDGSAAGTVRLTSFSPSPAEGFGNRFGVLPTGVLFTVHEENGAASLWRTDGTVEGTTEISAFPSGIESWPGLVASGNRALFLSRGWNRSVLWSTDGTAAGTRQVTSFSNSWWIPEVLYPLDEASWFFFLGNRELGLEPWITDGTAAGTRQWSEIRPGPDGVEYVADNFVPSRVAAGVLLLLDDGEHGTEPWLFPIDGSQPRLVADLSPGGVASWISSLGEQDGAQLLAFDGDLWSTDGTGAGTALVSSLSRTISPSRPAAFTDAGDRMYFVAHLPLENDGGHPGRTDGTETGSRLLTGDFGDGNVVAGVSVLDGGTVIGSTDLGESSLIFSSQGDEAVPLVGVSVVCDVHHTCPIGYLPPAVGSVSLFAYWSAEGTELWSLDGTPQGTQLFLDLLPGAASSRPARFVDLGDEAWFTALDGSGVESLWRSEGTPATTSPLQILGDDPEARVAAIWPIDAEAGRFYFLRPGDIGLDLWYVDSDASTPEIVRAGLGYWPLTFLGIVGEKILFEAREAKDPGFGEELWVSDGTATGTRLLRDIHPGPSGSSISWSAGLPEELVFAACEPVAGCEVWRSDGTTTGTIRLLDLVPGAASSWPRGFTRIGDFVYFTAERVATGREIWATDGTAAGTFQLPEISVGPWPSVAPEWDVPNDFMLWNERVYFAGDDGTGAELWAMPVLVFFDGFQTGDTSRWSAAR
jgi:ELWxxDGT repeat protein